MINNILGKFLVCLFCLLALIFCLCNPVHADISLPGYQQLGDNDNDAVTFSQLREYPFYVSLTSDITLTDISLENVSGLESDSSLVFFIDGSKVATGQPGAETAALNNPLSLSAGLHTLTLRGGCYDNGTLVPCSGSTGGSNFSIDDLDTRFVEPVTDKITGDLNNFFRGTNQSDGVEVTSNTNRGIDSRNGNDRLYIHGTCNNGDIDLGGGDDITLVGGNNNVSIDLGNGQNHLQIDGAHNSETITGSNQNDIVKIKGSAYGPILLYAGANKVEIGGNFTSTLVTKNQKDEIYIHGNVSGNINMRNGKDSLRIDGTITGSINGGRGNDTLYVNMTEDEWNNGSQKDNVEGFENLIFSDTPSDPGINENLEEDDFSFSNIIFHTSPSDESTNSIHFMQKRHLGDNDDRVGHGSGDGYGDIAEDTHPYYPDDEEGTSLSLQFTLAQPTSELSIDIYRLRALDFVNKVYIDNDEIGTLEDGGDAVDLGTDPYSLDVSGEWDSGNHNLRIVSQRRGRDYDDFSWDQIIVRPVISALPILEYRFDECSLNNGEIVTDSSGNNYSGTPYDGVESDDDFGKLCRGANFDGGGYVTVPAAAMSVLRGTSSLSFWIKTTQVGNDTDWKAPGVAGIEEDGGIDDIFWGFIDASGHIGLSVGNDSGAKSTAAINDGSFHHIVLTRDSSSGTAQVYVDGSLSATKIMADGIIGNTFNSIGRIENTGATAPVYLQAALDEVKIFGRVLTSTEIASMHASTTAEPAKRWDGSDLICEPCGPDHYRIEHAANGITCQASTVTVRACANDDCSQEYDQEATITLSATSNGSNEATWIGGDTRIFTGSVDFLLQQTTQAIETIEVSNISPIATNPTRYYEDGVEGDNTIQFYDTAIFIDGDSSDAENDSDIVTQIAGKPSNENPDAKTFQVKVLRTDENTGACVPALIDDGTAQFSYLVPEVANGLTDNTFSVNSNGDSTSLVVANTPKDLDLSFDGNGVASFDLTSTDTGKYQLQVDMDILVTDENGNPLTDGEGNQTGETYTLSDTSNSFIVRPLAVFVDATDNPNALDSEGYKFTAAGNNFTLNFKALSWNNNANSEGEWSAAPASNLSDPGTGNYARVPEWNIVQPEINVIIPADNGDLTFNEDATFAAGSYSVSVDAAFDDVGIIQFENVALDFMGEGILLNSPYIGRFYPDHFELTQGDLTNRVESSCSPASDFTYLGENLEFTYTLTAKNTNDQPTANYTGDFAKFDGDGAAAFGAAGDYTVGARDAASNTSLNGRLVLQTSNMTASWMTGQAEFKVKLDVNRSYPPDGPFSDTRFGVFVRDSDGVEIDALDLDLDVNDDGTNDHAQAHSSGADLRHGRINLENAYGSELLDLNVPMNVEYFKEGSFRKNSDDTCTEITPPLNIYSIEPASDDTEFGASDICVLDTGTPGVSGEGCKTPGGSDKQFSSPPDNGDFNLWFAAPGEGKSGSFMIEANVPDFLQYDWDNLDNDDNPLTGQDNPTARASFGIYKGDENVIIRQETTWR